MLVVLASNITHHRIVCSSVGLGLRGKLLDFVKYPEPGSADSFTLVRKHVQSCIIKCILLCMHKSLMYSLLREVMPFLILNPNNIPGKSISFSNRRKVAT